MSTRVKEMVMKEYENRFKDIEEAVIIDIRGIEANKNNEFRLDLLSKDIRVTVLKNTLARKVFAGTPLEALSPAFTGPSAIVYGADSVVNVAREIIFWVKKIKELDLKGAVLEGEYYEGKAGIKRLSEFPTRVEAQGKIVQLVLAPAGNVVGAAKSPGSAILGIVKEIQEKLEKGETIAKVG